MQSPAIRYLIEVACDSQNTTEFNDSICRNNHEPRPVHRFLAGVFVQAKGGTVITKSRTQDHTSSQRAVFRIITLKGSISNTHVGGAKNQASNRFSVA